MVKLAETISESEARERLWKIIEAGPLGVKGFDDTLVEDLIMPAHWAVDPDDMVPACPYCNEPKQHCRCGEDDENEILEITEDEEKAIAEAIREAVREEGGELELEDGSSILIARDGFDFCPVCGQQRKEELLYELEDSTTVGCKHCLDNPEDVVVESREKTGEVKHE